MNAAQLPAMSAGPYTGTTGRLLDASYTRCYDCGGIRVRLSARDQPMFECN